MKKKAFSLVVILLIIVFLVFIYEKNYSVESKSKVDHSLEQESAINDLSNYNKIVGSIQNEFAIDGYTEILGDRGDIVVVPDSITGKDESIGQYGFYQRSKKFVYKNPDNAVVIILSISADENRGNNVWEHSINYTEDLFNPATGPLSESYNEVFPSTEVAQYSFAGDGFSISVLGISDNLNGEEVFTISEIAKFIDQISKYLK